MGPFAGGLECFRPVDGCPRAGQLAFAIHTMFQHTTPGPLLAVLQQGVRPVEHAAHAGTADLRDAGVVG